MGYHFSTSALVLAVMPFFSLASEYNLEYLDIDRRSNVHRLNSDLMSVPSQLEIFNDDDSRFVVQVSGLVSIFYLHSFVCVY